MYVSYGLVGLCRALVFDRYNPGGKLTYSVMPLGFVEQSWFPDMSMTTFPGRTCVRPLTLIVN